MQAQDLSKGIPLHPRHEAIQAPTKSNFRKNRREAPTFSIVQTKDYKMVFGAETKSKPIAKIRAIRFPQNGNASYQAITDGAWIPIALLKQGQKRHAPLTAVGIEFEFLPNKEAKLKDLKDLSQHVDKKIRDSEFFTSIWRLIFQRKLKMITRRRQWKPF